MSDKPIHPSEFEKQYEIKREIVRKWPIYIIVLPIICLIIYHPPDLINRLVFGSKTMQETEFQKQAEAFQVEVQQMTVRIASQNKLIEVLKQKNKNVTLETDGVSIEKPVLQIKFQSWQEFKATRPSATFDQFRTEQVEFLNNELCKAQEFINKL